MRLIDADTLKETVHAHDYVLIDRTNSTDKGMFTVGIMQAIDEQPTIDAVPVVRCKDCIYYDGYYCHNKWWGDGYGNYTPPIKNEDGFCDWADEKEKHGKWIYHIDDLFPVESTQECSLCHHEQPLNILDENYCPNCGAKMDK